MIRINTNGSKWYGQEPDSIDTLLEVLGKHALRPDLLPFVRHDRCSGVTRFFGNFETVSHGFDIETDEPELAAWLRSAIDANVRRARRPVVV